MRHRGLIAAWSIWALLYVGLALLFLADARAWRDALASEGPLPLNVGLHYQLERSVWSVSLVMGAVCLVAAIIGIRRWGGLHAGVAIAVCVVTFLAASALSAIAVQSTPGRFNSTLDAGDPTGFHPDEVANTAGLLAFGAAASVLVGMCIWVLVTQHRQRT